MSEQERWEAVYEHKAANQVSWYRPHLDRSIAFIENAGLAKSAAIIDVGGGSSTLVNDLLERGSSDLTVLDIPSKAISGARERLGPGADEISWIENVIPRIEFPDHHYDFWHDRAVFHFLRDPGSRRRYVAAVRRGLKPGGHIVVATFGPSGPERCSGLDVMRYDAERLRAAFGTPFEKVASCESIHLTPWGKEQEFIYRYCLMLN